MEDKKSNNKIAAMKLALIEYCLKQTKKDVELKDQTWYKVNDGVNTNVSVTPAYKRWVLLDNKFDESVLNDKHFNQNFHKATYAELFIKHLEE